MFNYAYPVPLLQIIRQCFLNKFTLTINLFLAPRLKQCTAFCKFHGPVLQDTNSYRVKDNEICHITFLQISKLQLIKLEIQWFSLGQNFSFFI